MKRDMELIRKIAFKIEESPGIVYSDRLEIDSYDKESVCYHCALMLEAGLLVSFGEANSTDGQCYDDFVIQRLSFAGHDFIDAARNETTWNKTVTQVKTTVSSAAFEVFKQCLIAHAKTALGIGP